MAPESYREIEKPLAIRILELLRALQIVRDSLDGIRNGRDYHLITLSGQLRSLLAERSKKSKPLLLDLASRFNRPLEVFCMPDVNDPTFPDSLRKDLKLHIAGLPITLFRQYPAQEQITLTDLLKRKFILLNGNQYSPTRIIEWYANKAGGSHYSPKMPKDFSDLLSFNLLGLQPLSNVLVQIGEATLNVGRKLLKSLVDFEIHAVVVVPKQKVSDWAYLYDAQYEGTKMRVSLLIDNRLVPSFFASGLQGIGARVEADRLINWNSPRHIHAVLSIDERLSTNLELSVDGERVGRRNVPAPMFVLSDPLNYQIYHNRAVDREAQQFSFGMATIAIFSRDLEPIERSRMLLHFEAKRKTVDLPIGAYTAGSFGFSDKGTKDLTITGSVIRTTANEFLKGFDAKAQTNAD